MADAGADRDCIDSTRQVTRSGKDDGGGSEAYEDVTNGSPWAFNMIPVVSTTVVKRFNIDPGSYGNFKIVILNDSDISIDTTVEYRTADIPVAS